MFYFNGTLFDRKLIALVFYFTTYIYSTNKKSILSKEIIVIDWSIENTYGFLKSMNNISDIVMVENYHMPYKMKFVIDVTDTTSYISNSLRIQSSLEIQISTFLCVP